MPLSSLSLRIAALMGLAVLAMPTSAQTIYNGGTHVFSTPQGPDGIRGINGASFTVLSGAIIGAFSGTSSAVGIELDDTSTLTMSGGTVQNGFFGFLDRSTGTSSISGGTVAGGLYNIDLDSGGILNITGGNFNGSSHTLSAQNDSVINIYGTGLVESGTTITGTLQNGDSINVDDGSGSGGVINLINSVSAVPEGDSRLPLSGSLILLGVGSLCGRRALSGRRRA